MIAEAVAFLREELSRYLLANLKSDTLLKQGDNIILGNVAALESDTEGNLKNKVLISLVNIEEESTLKNNKNYLRNPLNNSLEYLQPPVYLNLYLLFSATLPETSDIGNDYETALRRLATVIEFFQAKKSFSIKDSPQSKFATTAENEAENASEQTNEMIQEELRLLPELYTLTFEQINHLWGSLGGKQVPFAMYKVRLVKIQSRYTLDAPLIEEIHNNPDELVAPKIEEMQS